MQKWRPIPIFFGDHKVSNPIPHKEILKMICWKKKENVHTKVIHDLSYPDADFLPFLQAHPVNNKL